MSARKVLVMLLLLAALLWGGCWFGGSTARVKLDMDRDRWELPHTAERVRLRWSANMKVRVELVNSSNRSMVVRKKGGRLDLINGLDVSLYGGDELLWPESTGLHAHFSVETLRPGESEDHEIDLNRYTAGWPLPPGSYRLRLMYSESESKREFPLLDKWVELEIK